MVTKLLGSSKRLLEIINYILYILQSERDTQQSRSNTRSLQILRRELLVGG